MEGMKMETGNWIKTITPTITRNRRSQRAAYRAYNFGVSYAQSTYYADQALRNARRVLSIMAVSRQAENLY